MTENAISKIISSWKDSAEKEEALKALGKEKNIQNIYNAEVSQKTARQELGLLLNPAEHYREQRINFKIDALKDIELDDSNTYTEKSVGRALSENNPDYLKRKW